MKITELEMPGLTTGRILKTVGIIVGLFISVLAVIMMLSIILFIPGIFALVTGLFIMVVCIPRADVECPSCEYTNKIMPPKVSTECERCKANIPVKWVGGSKWTSWKAWKK